MMDLVFEQQYWANHTLVVGVDEVGRGCLAGPVVVGAVVVPVDHELISGVNDSKKVSLKNRERLEPLIRQQAIAVGIGQVDALEIDQGRIVAAIRQAADAAIRPVIQDLRFKLDELDLVIISDGPRPIHSPVPGIGSEAIIDGDAKIYSIAVASIVAKVYRDRLMRQLATKYQGYGWETNVGYGTKIHYQAMQQLGLTPLHRRSFCHWD